MRFWFTTVLVLISSCIWPRTWAEDAPPPARVAIPLDQFTRFDEFGGLKLSPDGQTLAIAIRAANEQIWLYDLGRRTMTQLTFDWDNHGPIWTPDGKRIAYVSDRDGIPQIYCRWMDTGQTAKLTNLQTPPSGISWSPDGKSIAFTALVLSQAPQVGQIPSPPPGANCSSR